MSAPLTLRLLIDTLDETEASFDIPQLSQPERLVLSRETWESLGRPAEMDVVLHPKWTAP
jgi:hypothetical protein